MTPILGSHPTHLAKPVACIEKKRICDTCDVGAIFFAMGMVLPVCRGWSDRLFLRVSTRAALQLSRSAAISLGLALLVAHTSFPRESSPVDGLVALGSAASTTHSEGMIEISNNCQETGLPVLLLCPQKKCTEDLWLLPGAP